MSPLRLNGGFSTSATGLMGSPQTFFARWKIPCRSTSAFVRVLEERCIDPIQFSIIVVVIDSSGRSPKAGGSCARTIALYPATVEGFRPRSCSM
jgi:hypothetical protein